MKCRAVGEKKSIPNEKKTKIFWEQPKITSWLSCDIFPENVRWRGPH